jgi:hypothetical protein
MWGLGPRVSGIRSSMFLVQGFQVSGFTVSQCSVFWGGGAGPVVVFPGAVHAREGLLLHQAR